MATSFMVARTFRYASTHHAPVRSVVQDCWSRPMVPGAAGIAARTLKPVRPATAGSKREWANTVDSMAARTTRSVATCKKYETSVQDKGRRHSESSLRGVYPSTDGFGGKVDGLHGVGGCQNCPGDVWEMVSHRVARQSDRR